MPLYRDEGVVLRTAKLGEADRIVTILTRSHGKVRAVAKGVRRTKSRFGARLEPFMRADLLIAQGHSLDVVSQAESVSAYAGPITADYDAYMAANVIVETADKLVSSEEERVTGQYRLLIGALNALAKHAHVPAQISASYVMRALALAGWEPRLYSCVVCGGRPAADGLGMYLSMPAGGLMCGKDHTPESHRLSPAALTQLRALVDGDWSALDGVDLTPETEHLVEDWAEYYLERPLRSMRLLD
ncbi:DNA repair protein RecO [Bifidobacterium rousetti]|uniref:DNA repair protein RecO n=1 Tax=Bifidobacterium rousetti TaxID=2045439 RepID=UPI00123AE666|nr:DNA repair protein RecO [Bifidobacterium rousetti]KAA8819878.1 DNA repair protein RecO [Bifidobacterium rousetti]